MKRVLLVRHKTLELCMAAFLGIHVSALPKIGFWEHYDETGKIYRKPMKVALRQAERSGVWGFVTRQKPPRIHVWTARRPDTLLLIALFAHELGHTQPPRLRGGAEEVKAARYEDVTAYAIELAARVLHPRKRP